MKDSTKFGYGLAVSMLIVAFSVMLLIYDLIGIGVFLAMIVVSIVACIVPIFFFKGTSFEPDVGSFKIKAPFVDCSIRYDEIESLATAEEIDFGMRTFGYGGMSYGSGDFSNKAFGGYKLAATSKVPMFIIIRTKGRKTCVFNLKTLEETRMAYDTIRSRVSGDRMVDEIVMTPAEKKSAKKRNRAVIAVVAVILMVTAGFVGWAMTAGNIDAELTDDKLSVRGTMVEADIPYSDITSVELRDDVDYGSRVGGLANGKVLTGNFSNDEFGKYKLAVYRSTDLCIVVHRTSGTFVFNLDSDESTENFFESLNDRL